MSRKKRTSKRPLIWTRRQCDNCQFIQAFPTINPLSKVNLQKKADKLFPSGRAWKLWMELQGNFNPDDSITEIELELALSKLNLSNKKNPRKLMEEIALCEVKYGVPISRGCTGDFFNKSFTGKFFLSIESCRYRVSMLLLFRELTKSFRHIKFLQKQIFSHRNPVLLVEKNLIFFYIDC